MQEDKPVSDPAFWEAAYLDGRDGWELGTAAPPLARWLGEVLVSGSALVVGAGRGHEARAAAEAGWPRVVGLDFAATATAEAARLTSDALAARIEWRTQDLFTLGETDPERYGLVVEHTSFCAIHPDRRAEWLRAVGAALVPGGTLLALFYTHGRPGGPPFGARREDVEALLRAGGFRIERAEIPLDSVERRKGDEWLVLARRG